MNILRAAGKKIAKSGNSNNTRKLMVSQSWPVPYQNKEFKAYPQREIKHFKFDSLQKNINDLHYLKTREKMKNS